jgi:hypothetical protein
MHAMAREGLLRSLCAAVVGGLLSTVPALLPAAAGEDQETPLRSVLAVQTALQQGREHLLRGHNSSAVYALESQLIRCNGNREYLTTLRDAYRAYIKELRLAGKDADAEEYLKRLRILDPGAILDGSMTKTPALVTEPAPGAAPQPQPAAPPAQPPQPPARPTGVPAAATPPAAEPPARPPATVRGKMDDDPFRSDNSARHGNSLLDQAEAEFAGRRYENAGKLFEQAYQASQGFNDATRERWAYCKYYVVVQQLNQAGTLPATDLEREVRLAQVLAPRLVDYGKDLLRKIDDRRGGPAAAAAPAAGKGETPAPAAVAVAVRHSDRQADGWAVAETSNFRILHNQPRDFAEKVAQTAEATRLAMAKKWFGEAGDDWNPRCDVYLHATAADYSKATGVPANSPGHSTIRSEGSGRVVGRRIDLHCDNADLLGAVLPHEATHVVLAGRFGEFAVPRWADEGIAVLSEPAEKVQRHLRMLPQYRQEGRLLTLQQVMQTNDYPDPRHIGAFYAESVALVDMLVKEKDPQTCVQFLREGLKNGYEPALRRYYSIGSFDELEQRWRRLALAERGPTSVAEGNR